MDMSRIDTTTARPLDGVSEPKQDSLLLGIAVMLILVPCMAAWLFAQLVWRDMRRIGAFARLCGEAVREVRRAG